MAKTVVITGATGRQGGAVTRSLAGLGFQIKAMTRKPQGDAVRALVQLGAQIVQGDLDDAESLKRVLEGAWGAFAVQNTWEAGVEREEEQGKRFALIAREQGVQHFVYSSVGSAHRHSALREQVACRGNGTRPQLSVARHPAAGVLHGESHLAVVPAR